MNNQELKPCPFCNSEAFVLAEVDPNIDSYISYNFKVECSECGGQGSTLDVPHNTDIREAYKNAIDAWNKRA